MVVLKSGEKVSFSGVCSYTTETAKNGSWFVRGLIRDRKDVVPFKIWDATSLDVDLLKVVKITGLVKEYKNETYIEATEVVNDESASILNYVEAAPIAAETMLEDLQNVAKMCSEAWSGKLLELIGEQEGILLCASLPKTAHTERAGLLFHIHEAAFQMVAEMNRLERLGTPLNKDIAIPATVLSKLYNVEFYGFDAVTGEATSEQSEAIALVGKVNPLLVVSKVAAGMPYYAEIVNAVGAVNYLCDPATPEAMVVRECYYRELASYEALKLSMSTKEGKTAKGTKYTFVGTAPEGVM